MVEVSLQAPFSLNCCYELGYWIAAGCDVLTGTVMEIWNVTFGLMIHRMVGVAARKWEWLDKYHREHPNRVETAVVAIVMVIGLTMLLIGYCCSSEEEEDEEEEVDPPLVPTPLPIGPHLNSSLT